MAMEIEAALPPPAVRFENSFQKNLLVKKMIRQECDRDILEPCLGYESEMENLATKYIPSPKSQLMKLIARNQTLIRNWKIERMMAQCIPPWKDTMQANIYISKKDKEKAAKEHNQLLNNWNLGDSIEFMDAELKAELKAMERKRKEKKKKRDNRPSKQFGSLLIAKQQLKDYGRTALKEDKNWSH
ncbi:hypothetical protein M501DRAFT_1000680 [Patellaria atrata CBS 101060]|uniref:Uncharacterized protein n=1 Tax=Patellaria atrata CBS 101060 TaxID=1346257 RepID=A0A9P4SFA0_9PEZI|nr:hypothetical protein M501DRAFT_1000680 [Patellaria atrata CBS 101060]